MLAGEFYEILRDYNPAIDHFKEAIRIRPNHAPGGSTYYYLSALLQKKGRYKECIQNIDEFLMFRNSNPDLKTKAIKMKGDCLFALDAIQNPVAFDPINVGPGINTEYPEYFPTITIDGKSILFTRRIPDSRIRG